MAAKIHIGSRSFDLPDDPTPQEVGARVAEAVAAKGLLTLNVLIAGSTVTLFVNTAQVETIVVDPEGVGQGFFHG